MLSCSIQECIVRCAIAEALRALALTASSNPHEGQTHSAWVNAFMEIKITFGWHMCIVHIIIASKTVPTMWIRMDQDAHVCLRLMSIQSWVANELSSRDEKTRYSVDLDVENDSLYRLNCTTGTPVPVVCVCVCVCVGAELMPSRIAQPLNACRTWRDHQPIAAMWTAHEESALKPGVHIHIYNIY